MDLSHYGLPLPKMMVRRSLVRSSQAGRGGAGNFTMIPDWHTFSAPTVYATGLAILIFTRGRFDNILYGKKLPGSN